ncbi:MAG TPA: flagellar basal body L-ring protein FlgH [Tepidisphaeraceae bacterium]|nr:flagellar basal body L-ring protein FlgH [Tepidisphaeraceae bacterium]
MKKKFQRIGTKLGIVSAACLSGAAALGQVTPVVQAPTALPQRGGEGSAGKAPAKPANNNTAAQAGAIMQRTGGSLLKATLAARADPGQAKLSQVSFFAVPEKKPKSLKKHDLVTIIINEQSQSASNGKNDFQKNAELQAQVNQMVQLQLGKATIRNLPIPATPPGIDFTGKRSFTGQGEQDRSDSITARITAEILDVKPNGTLVLQARKRIKTDTEIQQFVLSGICRAEDITPDNSILSTQLFDLELQKNNKGDVKSAMERGNLPKLLDFLNPF